MATPLAPAVPATIARQMVAEADPADPAATVERLRRELVDAAVNATGCDPASARRELSRHLRRDPRPEAVVLAELAFHSRIEATSPGGAS